LIHTGIGFMHAVRALTVRRLATKPVKIRIPAPLVTPSGASMKLAFVNYDGTKKNSRYSNGSFYFSALN